jgi:hypothetical protein
MAYFSVLFITTKNIKKDFPHDSFAQAILDILQHIEHPFYKEHAIHAEIIINNTAYSAVGLPPDQCVRCYTPNPKLTTYDCVEIYHIPLTDSAKAQKFLDRAVNTPATYAIPVLDFLMPKFVLDLVNKDYECGKPSTWAHLYCSQFALLFIRYCKQNGLLDLPGRDLSLVDPRSINSNKCSPMDLMHILNQWDLPRKKTLAKL